ncbi:nucleotide-binding protein [Lentisalinibacter orientalis]|uniref:nucleotide-binding protein n=1 Tax=Lentisalinibacter orientalis TaxID=2992241 RepID=UPI00386BEC01
MLTIPTRPGLNRIVVLNSKGGCGKTTLATNLASHYALRGPRPALMDCDPQGSAMRWLERRPAEAPPVHGIAAYKRNMAATQSWQLRVPQETETLIVDSPAGLDRDALRQLTRDATSLIIPVMPSAIDIHATARFIGELLIGAGVDRRRRNVAVVANRIRRNTRSFIKLTRFLESLEIPVIAALRDVQAYVSAAEDGIGLYEMKPYRVRKDLVHLDRIVAWLEGWRSRVPGAEPEEPVRPGTQAAAPTVRDGPQWSAPGSGPGAGHR